MPAPFFPNSATVIQAEALRTDLALSVIKLFQFGFTPTVNTVAADLDAEECDYDDYAPQTITAWLPAGTSVYGGSQITAPTEQFLQTGVPATPNMVGGYWIETAGGEVMLIRQFDDPVPMAANLDQILITPTIVFPNGQ